MARILLVEDNEMNRDLISRKLKRQGYEILLAEDGAEGIEKATDESPDLILMDMGLPILDGYAATRLLKGNADTQKIPIIGLSAHAMTGDADKALQAGCDDYDTKPIEWERLLEKVHRALETAHATTTVESSEIATTAISPETTGVQTGHVLVVDDSAMHREVLGRRLSELGFTSDAVDSPLKAVEQLAQKPYDVVLLDVSLPNAQPREVLKQVKEDPRQEGVPVLMLSPVDAVDDAIGCLRHGAEDYIPQPFHAEVLEARLRSCLERRRLHEQKQTYKEIVSGEERHSEHLLNVLFPAPIVEELKATRKILPRRCGEVAVLVCDVADFSRLSDASEPVEILTQLQELIGKFEEIAERHQVVKVKTIAETFMAAVGLFQTVANPVATAVSCALDLYDAAARLRPSWNLRIGIHVGPVVAGVVGRKRYQFDLWGSTVETAGVVKTRGALNAVNVSETAWLKVSSSHRGQLLGSVMVREGENINLYRVDGATQ